MSSTLVAVGIVLFFTASVPAQAVIVNQGESERNFAATDKDRFEQGIAMLKGYYDALEGRVAATVALFVGVVGWLITSGSAREALSKNRWLVALAGLTLTLLLVMFAFNVAWWLHRWAEIKGYVDALHYVEPQFYDLPRGGWVVYFAPVAVLYVFIIRCLYLISTKRFV